jgi:hypothetical protein
MCGALVLGAVLVLAVGEPADPAAVSGKLDELIRQSCQEANLALSPRADDATLLRRYWLDLAGRTPPAAEVRKVLAAAKPLARSELVDQLLASPEAANHWARMWAEYYLDARPYENDGYNGRLLQRYLFEAFQKDKSYSEIARELLEGSGPSDVSGPANLLLRYEASPPRLAAAVSKKFLGCTLQCAECHDHPHEDWKQEDFWGLAAYFARLRRMTPVEEPEGDNFFVLLERRRGELKVPDPAAKPDEEGNQPTKTVYPRLPGAAAIDTSDDRRAALIVWLTSAKNPFFARHFVNRTWRQFFGEDLAGTLDQAVSAQDQAPSPSAGADREAALENRKALVLDLLAADFAASGYDVKRLLRVIAGSETYQRSCAPPPDAGAAQAAAENETLQVRRLARFPMRPLSVDQLYLSIAQATGYYGDDNDIRLAKLTDEDFSADQPGQYFGAEALLLTRSIALLNGDYLRGAAENAAAATGRLYGDSPGARHIEWMFLGILSRRPTAEEMEWMLDLAGRENGLSDVAWALLNSAEFNTVH